MTTETATIATSQLMPFREYDREASPAPQIPFVHQYTFEEIVQWVASNGVAKPLELSIYGHLCLLTDGNHRIAAAHKLGIKEVPVTVNYYDTLEELQASFHPQTIARFRPIVD